MRYWWVNQNQTYKHEVYGGYLWSPKTNTNGARNQFYDNMILIDPGDVVFSFSDTLIKAVGIVTGKATTAPRPTEFGTAGSYWGEEGWFVPVTFRELSIPIRPSVHMDILAPLLPEKYAPLQMNGRGLQGVYLTELPGVLSDALIKLLGDQVEKVISAIGDTGLDALDDVKEKEIRARPDIPETEKEQLIKSRRGQGLFKSRVELIEAGCRITGVTAREHLRASHIKPWCDSNNSEKLDGNNGLLLAPHIDHLFDRGFISFSDAGQLLVSSTLDASVLDAWSISPTATAYSFKPEQCAFLAFHRENKFKK
jgi:putative restriction endonuclease